MARVNSDLPISSRFRLHMGNSSSKQSEESFSITFDDEPHHANSAARTSSRDAHGVGRPRGRAHRAADRLLSKLFPPSVAPSMFVPGTGPGRGFGDERRAADGRAFRDLNTGDETISTFLESYLEKQLCAGRKDICLLSPSFTILLRECDPREVATLAQGLQLEKQAVVIAPVIDGGQAGDVGGHWSLLVFRRELEGAYRHSCGGNSGTLWHHDSMHAEYVSEAGRVVAARLAPLLRCPRLRGPLAAPTPRQTNGT